MDIKLTYDEFLAFIYGLADKLAPGHPVWDAYDKERGIYTARVCGVRYTARPGSRLLTGIAGTHRYTCYI